jgi:hypothetical protein
VILFAERLFGNHFCLADLIERQQKCNGFSVSSDGWCKHQVETAEGDFLCRHPDVSTAKLRKPWRSAVEELAAEIKEADMKKLTLYAEKLSKSIICIADDTMYQKKCGGYVANCSGEDSVDWCRYQGEDNGDGEFACHHPRADEAELVDPHDDPMVSGRG